MSQNEKTCDTCKHKKTYPEFPKRCIKCKKFYYSYWRPIQTEKSCHTCKYGVVTGCKGCTDWNKWQPKQQNEKTCNTCKSKDVCKLPFLDCEYQFWKPVQSEPEKKQEVCVWTVEVDEDDIWHTSCDNDFVFTDGNPEDNKFKHCPYCGKRIEVKP